MIIWPAKAADEVADFVFDFTAALDTGETISSVTVTPDGVTVDSDAIVDVDAVTAAGVQLWLSAGVAGTVAKVVCTIVTSGARTYSEVGVLPIGGEAVSLATAKAAQRIEVDDEDALLAGFLRAAIGAVEAQTGRNLTAKVVTQTVDGFARCDRGLRLFKGPVSEILSVAYDDSNGVEQALTSFRLVEGAHARLLPAYGESWPIAAFGPGTVRVTYVAGYDPAELPPELTLAATLLFGHFNANREAVVAGNAAQAAELPLGVAALIEPYRSVGIG